jgi:hypothetical protein
MDDLERPAAGPVPIQTRGEFHQAVRAAIAEAAAHGGREIWLCDNDFADWPLNERELIEQLVQWAGAHRKLTLLARGFDEFARRHARWVAWRRVWSHVVECRANNELEAGQMPTLLLLPGRLTLRLADPQRYRGTVSRDAGDALRAREQFDEILQRSQEAFPVTNLGL